MIKFSLFHRKPRLPLGARAFDLLCLTVLVVLTAHAPHLPVWFSGALVLVLGLRWWQRRKHGGRAPLYLKLPLIALLSAAVIFHYGTLFGREPGAALAVGLLVLKLLESEATRDARVGAAFACFALMTALLFDQGMLATLLVALGLLPALATLRALEPAHGTTSLPRELLPALGLLAVSLPLALLAFLLVPRLSSPLWGAPNAPQARTGLSDDMAPGDFFDLLTDDRPAMRVSFAGQPPQNSQRYFRAYVMSQFDGRRWSHVDGLGQPPAEVEHGKTVDYTVDLEASGQRVLPALDVPINAPEQAQLGPNREVIADRPINDTLTYSLQSALSYRLQSQLGEPGRRRGLQLPAGFNPRSLALAARWRAQYGANDSAVIKAALSLFHDGGFSYTLAPAPLGRDSVDDFLFSTHEGFCQHYASAFTVLMRAAGIPARVVTGYQGGFWNAMGNYLLVRQSDAHAWSEVWLPARGWTRVDPTAAVRPERVSLGAAATSSAATDWSPNRWWLGLRNRWDIVNRWWNQGVIGFDALRQHGLLTPFGVRDTDPGMLGLLLAIGGILFAALGLAWALWRRPPADPLRAAMQLLERRLAVVDVARRHSEGPQHFFSRAGRALPAQRAELDGLMRTYLELRYAHDEPPPNLVRNFRLAVQDFRPRRMVK
ncbi:transglutaminase TgpA family protein [Dyella sp. Tek66A03]|uniref:transglutaminase TgpA family protein n=1 Tax=Dyella sp. Tek66A03 TaxID=3458298 RepID=UPI00403ED55E